MHFRLRGSEEQVTDKSKRRFVGGCQSRVGLDFQVDFIIGVQVLDNDTIKAALPDYRNLGPKSVPVDVDRPAEFIQLVQFILTNNVLPRYTLDQVGIPVLVVKERD